MSLFILKEKHGLLLTSFVFTRWMSEGCVGNVGAIPRLNFPSLCMQDSPLGVRMSTSSIHLPGSRRCYGLRLI